MIIEFDWPWDWSRNVLLTWIAIGIVLVWFASRPSKVKRRKDSDHEDCDSIKDAPDHPHLQAFICNDPPTADDFMCPADNVKKAWAFNNKNASGLFLPLHRPTYDKVVDKSGNYPFSWHFSKRKRLWEMRFQMKFKRKIQNDRLRFGIELDAYVPMNAATSAVSNLIVKALRGAVGDQLYHSKGDDPAKVSGELERPVFAMPLVAFDQFIVTPAGETPPDLATEISEMGSLRVGRVNAFKKEISELELTPGATFTFCFWGISRWLDNLNWVVLPVIPGFMVQTDFNDLCGHPPVHLCLYDLEDSATEKRHVDSRKDYFLKVLFWSSQVLPPQEILQKFVPKDRLGEPALPNKKKKSSPKASASSARFMDCCTARER